MKTYKIETFILDSNMKLIENTKKVYDFGEYLNIEEAFEDLIGMVMCQTPNGAMMNEDTHSLTFLNGVNMVKWMVKEI